MDHATFFGFAIEARPGLVMTPRATSEALVLAALDHLDGRPGTVADVGTGSGAIAIALAGAAPQVSVWATDVDRDAVALARRNVRRHGLAGRVHVRRGDLLAPVPGPLDAIVANLPYLPEAEAPRHADLAGEPPGAVFAPADGLGGYRRLLRAARARLAPDGLLAIQLRGRMLAARRGELDRLEARLCDGGLTPATALP